MKCGALLVALALVVRGDGRARRASDVHRGHRQQSAARRAKNSWLRCATRTTTRSATWSYSGACPAARGC